MNFTNFKEVFCSFANFIICSFTNFSIPLSLDFYQKKNDKVFKQTTLVTENFTH